MVCNKDDITNFLFFSLWISSSYFVVLSGSSAWFWLENQAVTKACNCGTLSKWGKNLLVDPSATVHPAGWLRTETRNLETKNSERCQVYSCELSKAIFKDDKDKYADTQPRKQAESPQRSSTYIQVKIQCKQTLICRQTDSPAYFHTLIHTSP